MSNPTSPNPRPIPTADARPLALTSLPFSVIRRMVDFLPARDILVLAGLPPTSDHILQRAAVTSTRYKQYARMNLDWATVLHSLLEQQQQPFLLAASEISLKRRASIVLAGMLLVRKGFATKDLKLGKAWGKGEDMLIYMARECLRYWQAQQQAVGGTRSAGGGGEKKKVDRQA